MILFTGGFPFAGKSEFVRLLADKLGPDGTIVIEPKEFYPKNYDKLPEEKRSAIATAAWEVCLEQVSKLTTSQPTSKLIILDTAAKRLHVMRPLFVQAKVSGHKVFYVFVAAAIAECKNRADGLWKDSFEEDYSTSFETTVPVLKRLADIFTLVINHDDPERGRLNKAAEDIAQEIKLG